MYRKPDWLRACLGRGKIGRSRHGFTDLSLHITGSVTYTPKSSQQLPLQNYLKILRRPRHRDI
jgi:hypothetical protein